jgi:outer membrane protein OmpA-like peptidoglycan-associated protein
MRTSHTAVARQNLIVILLAALVWSCAANVAPGTEAGVASTTQQPAALGAWVHDDELGELPLTLPSEPRPTNADGALEPLTGSDETEDSAPAASDQAAPMAAPAADEGTLPATSPRDDAASTPAAASPRDNAAPAPAAASTLSDDLAPSDNPAASENPASSDRAAPSDAPTPSEKRAPADEPTPRQQAAPAEPIVVSHDARGKVLTIRRALFAQGTATAEASAAALIDELVAMLALYPGRSVLIESHTDDAGPAPANLQLSEARGSALRSAFAARGIFPQLVEARGYGEAYPVTTNATEEGRRTNDRIEIIVRPSLDQDRYRESYEASVGDLTPY